jgi:hypothetical protein
MLALLLQTMAGPPAELDRFDLAKVPRASTCRGGTGNEIVVCGRSELNRLFPLDGLDFEEGPLRAETNIAGGKLGLATESANVGGFQSNRLMFKFKLPF